MNNFTWITVTLADNRYRKRVRADAIIAYGTLPHGNTYVDLSGRALDVCESEADIARLLGDTCP
jgi:hypothetical protein